MRIRVERLRIFCLLLCLLLFAACGRVVKHGLTGEDASDKNVVHLYTYSAGEKVGAHIIKIGDDDIFRDPTHYVLSPARYVVVADWSSYQADEVPAGADSKTASGYLGPILVFDSYYRSQRQYTITADMKPGKAYFVDVFTSGAESRNPNRVPTRLCLLEADFDDANLRAAPSSAITRYATAGVVVACSK